MGGPGLRAVLIVVLAAFAAGIAVGWGTGLIGEQLAAPASSPTPTPSPSASSDPEVSVPPLTPIDRELDEADALAGLNTLEVPLEAAGSFIPVSAEGTPSGDAGAIRWVRVEYEDGLDMSGRALSQFVLAALNDPRSWAARGRYEFVPTQGAPDIRIVIASPTTVAAACATPHAAARVGAEDAPATPEPSPTPTPAASPQEAQTCADRGLVMISLQDWAAGLPPYGDDRTGSRVYQVNHGVGHVLGDEDGVCASGRALIMTDQRELAEGCEPNPWPWPDEPVPAPSASPTPSREPDAQ